MKKKISIITVLFLIFSSLLSQQIFSQRMDVYDSYLGKGHLLIKGKIENKPANMQNWVLTVTDYIKPKEYCIQLSENGSFEQAVPITDIQDIYLSLFNNTAKTFSYPGDTIGVYIDANNPEESILLKGNTPNRQKELELSLLIEKQFKDEYNKLYNTVYDEISDNNLLSEINKYYDSVINAIDSFENKNGSLDFILRFRNEVYFSSARIIAERRRYSSKMYLLPKIHCKYPRNGFEIDEYGNQKISFRPYNEMNYSLFRISDNYRSYLSSYIHNSQLDFIYFDVGEESAPGFSPTKDDYYYALSTLKAPPIRDWYIVNLLNSAFTYNDFTESTFIYEDFKKICKNEYYLQFLEERYQAASKMQASKPAPDFELPDENGKTVRLSDLKGKIVYIDFWGQGCKACIPELKEHKDKLHEKYKDYEITYVYIYVTGSIEYWKKSIKDFNLKGINLIAEGWEENPVCRAYNIVGIPHYILIDEEGRIIDNKCDRPSQILANGERSFFDKFVKGRE